MAFEPLSHAEQVAAHLKRELLGGRWKREMPGTSRLQAELGLNRVTINEALRHLERQGVLAAQGPGRRRRVVLPEGQIEPRPLRLRYLPYDKGDSDVVAISSALGRLLEERGFKFHISRDSLSELRMNPSRVAAMVSRTSADAWIVSAGSSEVLDWFARQAVPAFSMFGRFSGLPIAAASPRKTPALLEVVRRLVSLGHRRIVMLVREERRKPRPALAEQAFLDELNAHGIETGPYNLPDWGSGRDDFHRGLDRLFSHTPPTAMIIVEPKLFLAARDHLAQRGILAPRDVSLVCDDPDPTFEWHDPQVSHIRWDHWPLIRRVARWAENIAHGKEDLRQTFIKAEFVEGGTIGPVPKGR